MLIFSGDAQWKKLFNRFLDSPELDDKDSDILMAIEKRIFENVRKEVALEWIGSAAQNSQCDFKISKCVKSSFMYYEKSKKGKDVSYFKFSK